MTIMSVAEDLQSIQEEILDSRSRLCDSKSSGSDSMRKSIALSRKTGRSKKSQYYPSKHISSNKSSLIKEEILSNSIISPNE